MRPPAKPQSALRAPFNAVLGTEANVRVVRLLSTLGAPVSAAELARRSALQPSGMRRILGRLVETGLVELVGIGGRPHARLRSDHPLARPLEQLFAAEAERARAVEAAIQHAVRRLHPPPTAAWLEGPVAEGHDRFGDPVIVGLLANGRSLDAHLETLREALAAVEREQDVTIELRGHTLADLNALDDQGRARLRDVTLLFGVPPQVFFAARAHSAARRRSVRTHVDVDARALTLGRAVGEKLARDPSLLARARDTVVRLLGDVPAPERRELREWLHILDTTSVPRLRRLLADPGARATRLRQSLPFLGVLTPAEREAALDQADAGPTTAGGKAR